MADGPRRHLLRIVFRNFLNSLRPRQIRGTLMGSDYLGNKYYEIPPNPAIGKRRTSRWFDPPEKDNYQQEIPAEWEAWLRGRRKEPPVEEEILKNLAIMKMKKENAAKLDEKYLKAIDKELMQKEIKGRESFPQYNEYEIMPGKPKHEK